MKNRLLNPELGVFFITCLICGQRRRPFDENDDVMPCECEAKPGQKPLSRKEHMARMAELAAKRMGPVQ